MNLENTSIVAKLSGNIFNCVENKSSGTTIGQPRAMPAIKDPIDKLRIGRIIYQNLLTSSGFSEIILQLAVIFPFLQFLGCFF